MRRATTNSWPDDDDDDTELSKQLAVLKVATPGPGIPSAISDWSGGVRATPQVTPEICTIINQLQGLLSNEEIAELLSYSSSTIRQHASGRCSHSETDRDRSEEPRNLTDEELQARVTDSDTMVTTGTGSDRFHLNADGEPACGHGHRGGPKARGSVRDAVDAFIWFDPCKICFWRHYAEGKTSRRIAELEYELHKRRRDE